MAALAALEQEANSPESGHVLIEVMAAIAIVSVGFSAVINTLAQLKFQSATLRERGEAAQAMAVALEQWRLGMTSLADTEETSFRQVRVCKRQSGRTLEMWLEWPSARSRCETPRFSLRSSSGQQAASPARLVH